jgi:competence protein ComEC
MDRQVDSRRPRVAPRTALSTLFVLLLFCATGCGLLPMSQAAQPPPADSLVVSFIDVGQGDAILVQSGGKSYLIDGGRSEEGPNVVDFLRSRSVKSLDGLVATHPDADHVGGLPDVLDAFDVATVYVSGDTKGTTTFNAFLRGVQDEGSQVIEARDGMRTDWGSTTVDVIAPPPGNLFEESNDNSVATLLTFGTARILLAGDAEKKEEEYMSNGSHTGPLTVLKVDVATTKGG